MPMLAMGEPSGADEASSAAAWTQNMPVTLHTCIQPPRSVDATAACASVGASTDKAMESMASQAVNRR
jgi:hypothetical protein